MHRRLNKIFAVGRLLLTGNARRLFLTILIPIGLLPIPLIIQTDAAKCGYGVLLMSCYWMLELLPLAITALIPIFLFPMLGLLSTDEVCQDYMKETLIIFLGSLIAATAVEHCNLHQRIALRVLLIVGTSPKWLLMGFMGTTTFLSMWISNTAATALMIPILEAVTVQLRGETRERIQSIAITMPEENNAIQTSRNSLTNSSSRKNSTVVKITEENSKNKEQFRILRHGLFLGICYAANIGGTGTMTGTPPNLILKNNIDSDYADYHGITFASWIMFNISGMIVCVIIAWIFLVVFFIRKCETKKESEENAKTLMEEKYKELGSMTFHEWAVLVLFIILLLLFFFRDPEFMPGWASMGKKNYLKDACAAIFIILLMFIIPANPKNCVESPALLNWKIVQDKVSWGTVLLLGGGFAMSDAAKKSQLGDWLAYQLGAIDVTSAVALEFIVCSIVLVLTEVTSNTATATILLPVIATMAKQKGFHPVLLMMPATICCSYSFMLPIATAPNAIIFDAAGFKSADMAVPGIVMKILCLCVIIANTELLAGPVLGVSDPLPGTINDLIAENSTSSLLL